MPRLGARLHDLISSLNALHSQTLHRMQVHGNICKASSALEPWQQRTVLIVHHAVLYLGHEILQLFHEAIDADAECVQLGFDHAILLQHGLHARHVSQTRLCGPPACIVCDHAREQRGSNTRALIVPQSQLRHVMF